VSSSFLSPFEKRAVIIIIALQALAISLPYLWALAVTPNGYVYGGLLFNPDDQNVHLSWARQAAEGHFFFRDLFTTESMIAGERPLFSNGLMWLVGSFSALTKIPLVWAHHIFRVGLAALALLLFYALCAQLTTNARVRIVALALAAFSGGAGYLHSLLPGTAWMDRPDDPVSPMVPEAFTFASAFVFTLNVASFCLLCLVYLLALRTYETGSRRAAVGAGVGALLLGNIHTYDVFPLLLALSAWSLWQWRNTSEAEPEAGSTPHVNVGSARWLYLPCVFIGAAIPVAYQLYVFRGSEEFRVKALTATPPPMFGHIVTSYGLLFVLAAVSAILTWRQTNPSALRVRLPICWALATFLILYAPVSFARKMIEGMHLPLCFLAAVGIVMIATKLQTRQLLRIATAATMILAGYLYWEFTFKILGDLQLPFYLLTLIGLATGILKFQMRPLRALFTLGVLLTLSLSSFQFVAWCLDNAQDNNASRVNALMPPLYLKTSDWQALQFLEKQPRGQVVLSLPFIGNYVPRETGQTAVAGHWAETLHFQKKLGPVLRFYTGQMSAAEAKNWLRENHINFVLVGSYETELGARLPLELPVVYQNDGAKLFKVDDS
jgi:tryptophan-rich sensory protein